MTTSLDALRYGLPGLAAILALFAFQSLRGSPSKIVVSTIRFLVICNLALFALVVGADAWNKAMDRNYKEDLDIQFEKERTNWKSEKQELLAQLKSSQNETIKITGERDDDQVALKLLVQMQHVIGIFGDVNPEQADNLIKKLHNDYVELHEYRKTVIPKEGEFKQLEEQYTAARKQIQDLNDTIASLKSSQPMDSARHTLTIALPLNSGAGNAQITARVSIDNKLFGGITTINADASGLNIPLQEGAHTVTIAYTAFAWQQNPQTGGNLILMSQTNQGSIQKTVALNSDLVIRLAIIQGNLTFLP